MSEMINRIGRAVCSALFGEYVGGVIPFDVERVGRAVLEAMREPTIDMIDAGTAADWVGDCEGRAGMSIVPTERPDWLEDGDGDFPDRRGIWAAMIDAAMKTKPPGD